jgi:hypothetical protein
LLRSGELTTLDLKDVIGRAQRWQSRLAGLEEALARDLKESVL